MKILCVDDEPSLLQSLERLFRDRFEVLTAATASHGLEILKTNPDCAVVLSDYRMPDMNGVEFLRQVRALYPLASRAILSGQMDLVQVSDAINQSDIHKFLLKPWENDYLVVQMIEAMNLHRTLLEKAHYEHLAMTDPVTQVTNHRFFQEQLRRDLHTGDGPVALLIFDVDHFKAFNDRFGHPEGDRLLYSVAQVLLKFTSGKGHVSRYGGEEFTVILPGHDKATALAFAESVRKHFESTPFPGLTSSPAYITLSAGLAVHPDHGKTAKAIIESADRSLYQAKRQGRNQVAAPRP